MTLEEALKVDPTIFDFTYTPIININGDDLKDLVKLHYLKREIGFETTAMFKFYLERTFLEKAKYLDDKLKQYAKLETMDPYVTSSSKGNTVARYYATPTTGFKSANSETNKNEGETSVESSDNMAVLLYKLYDDNYKNIVEDFLFEFEDLFMGVFY